MLREGEVRVLPISGMVQYSRTDAPLNWQRERALGTSSRHILVRQDSIAEEEQEGSLCCAQTCIQPACICLVTDCVAGAATIQS
jgi:hypothetical protein